MKITSLITWAFAHPGLGLAIVGGAVVVLLALATWMMRRSVNDRRIRRVMLPSTTDTDTDASSSSLWAFFKMLGASIGRSAKARVAARAPDDEPKFGTNTAIIASDVPTEMAASAPADAGSRFMASGDGGKSAEKIRATADAVFEASFPKLPLAAWTEARDNFSAFSAELGSTAPKFLSSDEMERMAHADIQILLHKIVSEVSKRHDPEKNSLIVSLIVGRVKHHGNPEIVELLEQATDVIGRISISSIKIVIMCLYLRSIQLKNNQIGELENIVKYAASFGHGARFSNVQTGSLFSQGLLMYNAYLDRIEGHILRNFGQLFDIDESQLESYPGDNPSSREFVHRRLNLSPEQTTVLDTWGQSQCGRATATGLGWAAAAAYMEHQTGQPADWERMVR